MGSNGFQVTGACLPGDRPCATYRLTAHGQGCTSGQHVLQVPGVSRRSSSDHGRWQAHLAEECAFPAGSGQAVIPWMLLPLTQGQGDLTLPSLNGGRTAESSKLKGPQRLLCPSPRGLCLAICCPSHGNTEGGAAGKWTVPHVPMPGSHLSLALTCR